VFFRARDHVQAAKADGQSDKDVPTFDIATLVHSGKTRATLTARGSTSASAA